MNSRAPLSALVLPVALAAALGACGGTTHHLQVARHTSADIGEVRADQILTDATVLLRAWDGPGDATCAVTLARQGSVVVFDAGDGSIDSEADLDEVLATPGQVKVVQSINWCNGIVPDIKGCTRLGGKGIVVTRAALHQEGVIWAHELGHAKGLLHRETSGALMRGKVGTLHRRVDDGECDKLRKGAGP
jgi:hypothetical protein